MKTQWLLAALAVLLMPCAGLAEVRPTPGQADSRIRSVLYDPDQVVLLEGVLGYATTVEFAPGEKIENVSIGDSLGWQITPNRRANLLFIKPVDKAAPTDMTVVTNLRRYNFDLRVIQPRGRRHADVTIELRFDYPTPAQAVVEAASQPAAKAPETPQVANSAYVFKGVLRGLPTAVFDDGQATYFQFGANTDYPAILAVDDDGKEAVNISYRDGYMVVDRLAGAFVLRRGAEVTRVTNNGYKGRGPAPTNPSGLSPGKRP
jgi:type IV secretion system protein VirB9